LALIVCKLSKERGGRKMGEEDKFDEQKAGLLRGPEMLASRHLPTVFPFQDNHDLVLNLTHLEMVVEE
jgi:hypothetical protein